MTRRAGKPVLRRARADRDVVEAIDHYAGESTEIALVFVDAMEGASRSIGRSPSIGSPRYGHELNLPGLRFWRCRRFPYLIFCFEHPEHIEVMRVLHVRRDIPDRLAEERTDHNVG